MSALSRLFVDFTAGTDKFHTAMDQMAGKVKTFDDTVKTSKDNAASIFDGVTKAFSNFSLSKFGEGLGELGDNLKDLGKGLTELAVPFELVGGAAIESALQIEEAMDTIIARTGASGEELKGLGETFESVFTQVPNSVQDVSTAIAALHVRTGESGEALNALATQLLNISRLTGTDINTAVDQSTRLFNVWDVATQDQASTLDYLLHVTQRTNIGFGALTEGMVNFAVPLKDLGFSLDQSAAMLGLFEKSGVRSDLALRGLNQTVSNMAAAGIKDFAGQMRGYIQRIQDAASATDAIGPAIDLFGKRAGPQLANAIRQGRFDVDQFVESLKAMTETANQTAARTLTFTQQLEVLGHQLMVALDPLGKDLIAGIESSLPFLKDLIGLASDAVKAFEQLSPTIKDVLIAGGLLAAGAGPGLFGIGLLARAGEEAIAGFVGLPGAIAKIGEAFGVAKVANEAAAIAQVGPAATAAAEGITAATGATTLWGAALNAIPWVAAITALTAIAIEAYNSNRAWADSIQAQDKAAEGIDKLAAKLRKAGVDIPTKPVEEFANTFDELHPTILQNADAIGKWQEAVQRAAAANSQALLPGLRLALPPDVSATAKPTPPPVIDIKAAQQFKNQVDETVKSVGKESNEIAVLAAALTQLEAKGVSSAAITEALGGKLLKTAEYSEKYNVALAPLVSKYAQLDDAQNRTKATLEDFNKAVAATAEGAVGRLEQKLADLLSHGFDRTDLIKVYGAEIVKLGQAHLNAGGQLDGFLKPLFDEAKGFVDNKNATVEYNASIEAVVQNLKKLERTPADVVGQFERLKAEHKSDAEINQILGASITKARDLYAELPSTLTAAKAAELAEADATLKAAQAHEELDKKVQASKDALDKFRRAPANTIAAFQGLQSKGASPEEITSILGGDIDAQYKRLVEEPAAFSAAEAAKIRDAAALKQSTDIHNKFADALITDSVTIDSVKAASTGLNEEYAKLQAKFGDTAAMQIMADKYIALETNARHFGIALDAVTQGTVTQSKAFKDSQALADEWAHVWENSIKKVRDGFAESFAKFIVEGKDLGDSMKRIFQDIAETIITVLIKGALARLAQALSTVLGGGGGAPGFSLGSILGGLGGAGGGFNLPSISGGGGGGFGSGRTPTFTPGAGGFGFGFQHGGIMTEDNIATLHKQEMVLPADLSTGLINMIRSGNGRGSVASQAISINVHLSPQMVLNTSLDRRTVRDDVIPEFMDQLKTGLYGVREQLAQIVRDSIPGVTSTRTAAA